MEAGGGGPAAAAHLNAVVLVEILAMRVPAAYCAVSDCSQCICLAEGWMLDHVFICPHPFFDQTAHTLIATCIL